jgi:hypothetical protein
MVPAYVAWLSETMPPPGRFVSLADAPRVLGSLGFYPAMFTDPRGARFPTILHPSYGFSPDGPRATWQDLYAFLESNRQRVVMRGNRPEIVGEMAPYLLSSTVMWRLRRIPRRHAILAFVELMREELLSGKYSHRKAAEILSRPIKDVRFLIRHKSLLFDLTEPCRRAAGLGANPNIYRANFRTLEQYSAMAQLRKEIRAEAQKASAAPPSLKPEMVAMMLPYTTPTGILGLLARVSSKEGERAAYNTLRFLERALRSPVGREDELVELLARHGMAAQRPQGHATRTG